MSDASRESTRKNDLSPISQLSAELGQVAIKSGLPPRETMLAMFHAMVGLLTVGTAVPESVAIVQIQNMIKTYEKEMIGKSAKQN